MKKQFAVFGLGSFGESIALELQKLGCEVVAVDKDMERVKRNRRLGIVCDAGRYR